MQPIPILFCDLILSKHYLEVGRDRFLINAFKISGKSLFTFQRQATPKFFKNRGRPGAGLGRDGKKLNFFQVSECQTDFKSIFFTYF